MPRFTLTEPQKRVLGDAIAAWVAQQPDPGLAVCTAVSATPAELQAALTALLAASRSRLTTQLGAVDATAAQTKVSIQAQIDAIDALRL